MSSQAERPEIIVLEHDRDACNVICKSLASGGFRLRSTNSIDEAEEALNSGGAAFVGLLGDTADALARNVGILRRQQEKPLLAVVPDNAANLGLASLGAGADDVIFKPIGVRDLLIRLNSALRRYRRNQVFRD